MPIRKSSIAEGEVYHLCSRSIAEYKIFNTEADYVRLIDLILFHSFEKESVNYSTLKELYQNDLRQHLRAYCTNKIISLIAYCVMPTHVHFIIREIHIGGVAKFMMLLLQGYTKYFNALHKRKGPLWESRFTNVPIKSEEQLMHTIRYVHLNPSTAYLVKNPIEWEYSSYREYLGIIQKEHRLCDEIEYAGIEPTKYRQFVESAIDLQRIYAQNKR